MGLKHLWGRDLRTNAFVMELSKLRSWNLREECFPEGTTKDLGETENMVPDRGVLRAAKVVPFPTGHRFSFQSSPLLCRMFGSVSFVAATWAPKEQPLMLMLCW